MLPAGNVVATKMPRRLYSLSKSFMGSSKGSGNQASQTGSGSSNKFSFSQETNDMLNKAISSIGKQESNVGISQYTKRFKKQGTYHPWDLNEMKVSELRKKGIKSENTIVKDPFKELNINPLVEYKNVNLLTKNLTDMGMIIPRGRSGLSRDSQKKLAKAVKRARAFGLISYTSRDLNFM